MPATCENCDADVAAKNAAGDYNDWCRDCLDAHSDSRDRHHETCTDADCLICQSHHDR